MKIAFCFFAALIVLASSAFALGPVPVTLWAGAAGGSFGAGMNAGMDIGLTLPAVPAIIVEAESSGTIIPLALVNVMASTTRVGLVGKFNIIGDVLKLRLSAGTASISTDTVFPWGNGTISRNNSTYYISIGPEVSFLGFGAMARAIFMPLSEGTVGEVDLNLMVNF